MARIDPDKALGALLGLAAGDAAGGGGDATELALALGATLVEAGGYDSDRALGAYVGWHRAGGGAGRDRMHAVLGAVAAGDDSYRATSTFHLGGGDSSGNGALVRATPIAVAFAGHDERLREATLDDAALTHFDPLAGKVALLHNQAVAWLLTGGPRRLYDELKDPERLDDRIEDVVIPATSGVRRFAETLAQSQPGSALCSLAIGLVAVFNADGFQDGLDWAVGLGADPPADGAVAGALLGARLGAGALPAPAVAAVARRAELESLAGSLVALAR